MKMEIEKYNNIKGIWECGGSYSSIGSARIIADKDGKAKKALKINEIVVQNGNHALIPIQVGDYIISANLLRESISIYINVVKEVLDDRIITENTNTFIYGKWDTKLDIKLKEAVEASIKKVKQFHCVKPYYITA